MNKLIRSIYSLTGKICFSLLNRELLYPCLLFMVAYIMCITGCTSTKDLSTGKPQSIHKAWDKLGIASKYHVGISIFEPDKNRWIFHQRDDNYFTPASNTKIFTMYSALQYLDEYIPAAYYQVIGDTMVVWGGADPGTRYPDIHSQSPFIQFLKDSDKRIVFSNDHFDSGRFGSGWAWDDYPYSFQCERTAFPIYGNRLWIERFMDSVSVTPPYIIPVLSIKKDTTDILERNEWGTHYNYHYDHRRTQSVSTAPLSLYQNDIRFIWKEATGKDIYFENKPFVRNVITIEGSHRDTMLKQMMHESDNFIAEHILLACALKETGRMNERAIIRKMKAGPLSGLPDSLYWIDGSGLSRYNLVTPRSIVWVLDKIIQQKGLTYLQSIFPAGGRSGTLIANYRSDGAEPYLFAKTGNMRYTHCLSGILITNSGKVLLFSWMHNQFEMGSSEIKIAMEKFFTWIRNNY